MCLVVPSEWDLRTRGALKGGGVRDAALPGAPYLHRSWPLGLPAYLPFLASWLTFYSQDSDHSKGGGHSCDITPGCRVRALGGKKASKALSPWCPA